MTSGLLKNLKVILIDLSGTLHIDDVAVNGSILALKRLQKSCLKLKFVTNTTKESKSTLYQRLKNLGYEIEEKELFTSLTAAQQLISKRNLRPFLMLSDDAKKEFENIETQNPNVVLIGLAPQMFDYGNMNKAFRLILGGASLMAIHKSRYYKRNDGMAIGLGAFVNGLEYSTGTTAEVVGKPEKTFFLSALEEFNCQPQEAIMIGDDARGDVEGALKAGLFGALVQTGKYRSGDELNIDPPPTLIGKNFSDIVDQILKAKEDS